MFCCITVGLDRFKRKSSDEKWHCPNCSDYSVRYIKSNQCLTICFVPLVPCGGTKRLYECSTCGWINVNQPVRKGQPVRQNQQIRQLQPVHKA